MADVDKAHEDLRAELKHLHEELTATKLFLAGAEQAVTGALLIVDGVQTIRHLNASAETFFAYPASEILGKPLSRVLRQRFHALHHDDFQRFFLAAPSHDDSFEHVQVNCYPQNGTVFSAEASIHKLEFAGEIFLVMRVYDVQEANASPNQNREQQRLFQLYNQLSADYVFSIAILEGVKPYYTWISNDAFKKVTGYAVEELGDANDLYHPEDKARADADREKTMREGINTEGEYRFITKSGEIRWLSIKRFAERDEKTGRIIYMHGVAQDVTERKEIEAQQLKLLGEETRVQSMTKFVTSTSHDLMTSISIIKTNAYLLRKSQDEDHRLAKLASIEKQSLRLQAIIEDMLSLVRLDSLSQTSMSKENIQIEDFLKEFLASFQRRLNLSDKKLTIELPHEISAFRANMNYLHMALLKLLENAIHYTPNGGQIRIYAHAAPEENAVHIGVADTGVGISDDLREMVFERFYRAAESRPSEQGTGLGLSIVKAVMDLHGGKILLKSEVGKGSDFTLVFPLS